MNCQKSTNYYLGLDIGTNSVGYAVTDEEYNLIKHGGEPMWGSHIFDEGKQAADRRMHRTARRRNDRKKQRIELVSEIFASEIAKVDERFFIRRRESALFRNDVDENDRYIVFNDSDYTDREYYHGVNGYPTIHHLINELMNSDRPHDVRLVYIACAYLVAHRGHFLSEVDKDNIEELLDFDRIYNDFMRGMENCDYTVTWNCDINEFKEILKENTTITNKEKAFLELLNNGKKYKMSEEDSIDKNGLIKLLCGGKYDLCKLFPKADLEEKISICFKKSEEEFEAALAVLDDEADVIAGLRGMYDWAVLSDSLNGGHSISAAKVEVYEQHKRDLEYLKKFIKKYRADKYYEIFKSGREESNYVAYSYNMKSVDISDIRKYGIKKADKEKFCNYIKEIVEGISVAAEDRAAYDDMMFRLSMYTFMPKQVDSDNRVIPYQLYYYELKKILDNAGKYLPFILEKDSAGYTNKQKILSIMEFRIPYYVGPLRTDNGQYGWMERREGTHGKIYPWNFEEKVDLDKSEQAFINKMINNCTYVPGEKVLPRHSLLYCSYNVLNEINNIRVNGEKIPVEHKQGIYGLFMHYRKVTPKRIADYLRSNNLLHNDDTLSGLDITVKSSLKSYHDFKNLLERKIFTEKQVEEIIERLTYCEERGRIIRWLEIEYPDLPDEDIKYISKLKYSDFGRFSKMFLTGIQGRNKKGGEAFSIIRSLWETNDNLMELLSDRYTFIDVLEELRKDYYSEHPATVDTLLNEMYISNAVKRPIYRTLDIVSDIRKACGSAPSKIFVEMARGGGEKGKRIKSRREQIQELYRNIDRQEIRELSAQLEGTTDNELQSEVLFLYFMQLGMSMYSDTRLDIEKLKTSVYNVDHIYPQCRVKDDSIDNKVLVLSKENGDKGDEYPVKAEIRNRMAPYWQMLRKNNLISEEKYKRLIRVKSFQEEELREFINRQIVETRQSAKAITVVLKEIFPETEIVYVKAGLVSDFRHEYGMVKCRSVNDNHHAKDAYLNIVVGNVYNCRFTKNFYIDQKYSLKTDTLFSYKVMDGSRSIWRGKEELPKIKSVLAKNNIHYTKYSSVGKGELFDQNPLKAHAGLVPRKEGLSAEKYGGYNKTSACGFVLVQYKDKGKAEAMIMPVELMFLNKMLSSRDFAETYVKSSLETIWGRKGQISDISFPLKQRLLKNNTMFSFDGFRACITGKSSSGKQLLFTSMMPLIIGNQWEQYVKKLDSFMAKKKKNGKLLLNEEYDGISLEKNIELYDILSSKITSGIYNIPFSARADTLVNGREKFVLLSGEEQVDVLLAIVLLLKSGRSGACNLSLIYKKGTTFIFSSKISNLKKNFRDVRIIDVSASGIYEKVSDNLMELV